MDELLEALKMFLDKHLSGNLNILEIGAGSGKFTGILEGFGSVTALDTDKEELKYLKEKFPDTKIRAGEAQKLPFDKFFDLVVFSRSLHHIPIEDMPQSLEEASRVLTKDGKILIIEPGQKGEFQQMESTYYDEIKERTAAQKMVHERLTLIDEITIMPKCEWDKDDDILDAHEMTDEQQAWVKEHLKKFTIDGKIIMTSEHWFALCKPGLFPDFSRVRS